MEETAAQPQQSETFYDWRQQWYPVHYAADLPEGEPQRVWLFDEAIVVARRPGGVLTLATLLCLVVSSCHLSSTHTCHLSTYTSL